MLSTLSALRRSHCSSADLTDALIDETFALVVRHADKERAEIDEQLRACDHIYLLRTDDGVLRGLICFRVELDVCGATPAVVLYGQWTILDRELRGRSWTVLACLDAFVRERLRHPLRPAFCIIKSSTYLSYLMLARNAGVVWPHRQHTIPDDVRALRDRVMARAVGDSFDAVAGVVRGKGAMQYFDGSTSDGSASTDPDVAFYAAHNPGQAHGDGLVVTAPFSTLNCAMGVVTMVKRWRRRRRRTASA